ncbi:MAG: hypothetical protein HFE59_06205 [Clostridiales bacterium]|nr:hypothetical protein [Clostridiales bacterium]
MSETTEETTEQEILSTSSGDVSEKNMSNAGDMKGDWIPYPSFKKWTKA